MKSAEQYILESAGLGNVAIRGYKKETNELPVGVQDDRPVLVVPEVIPFSNTPGQLSVLGTPIFADIRIEYGNDKISSNTVLYEISRPKIIVRTSLVGRDGTKKEHITNDDYNINLIIALVSDDNNYPEDQVRILHRLLEVNDELIVVSPLLQLLNIYNIVVNEYRLLPTEGVTNAQLFEISCYSDEPIELLDDGEADI